MSTKTLGDFQDSPSDDEEPDADQDCLCERDPEGPGCWEHYEE